MNENYMTSCGHWGMFPSGFYVSASPPGQLGRSYAVLIRTDETGRPLDNFPPMAPSSYNDMARQFMVPFQ
jgi:hypothetical protein